MKKPIRQAVNELINNADITNFKHFQKEVRNITETVIHENKLNNEIRKCLFETEEVIISPIDNELLIYRSKLAENAKVTIKITDEEKKLGKIYIGHRLMPFLNPLLVNSSKLIFEDMNGIQLNLNKEILAYEKAEKYFLFLNPHLLYNDHQGFFQKISLNYIDISNFLRTSSFFEVEVLDYKSLRFRLRLIPTKEIKQNHFLIAKRDKDLSNSIMEIVKQCNFFVTIDSILLCAYHHFAKENIKNPGSPFSVIYNQQREYYAHNNGHSVFLISQQKSDNLVGFAKQRIKQGIAKNLEGILNEMGLAFTKDFLYLCMICDLICNNSIDDDYILEVILEASIRLANMQQQSNLENAYNRLRNKAFKNFQQFDNSISTIAFMEMLIDSKIELIELLRDFDENLSEDENIQLKLLLPILDTDRWLDEIIIRFTKEKRINFVSLKDMESLFTNILKMTDEVRNTFNL